MFPAKANHLERIDGYLTTPISLGLSWSSPVFWIATKLGSGCPAVFNSIKVKGSDAKTDMRVEGCALRQKAIAQLCSPWRMRPSHVFGETSRKWRWDFLRQRQSGLARNLQACISEGDVELYCIQLICICIYKQSNSFIWLLETPVKIHTCTISLFNFVYTK